MLRKRGMLLLLLILFVLMFCIPFLSIGRPMPEKPESVPQGSGSSAPPVSSSSQPANSQPALGGTNAQFKILDVKSNQVITVSDRDFLYGAVAAEMSPQAEPEALKAQAVAAYTYYSRERELQRQKPDPALKGADFEADTQNGEIYVPRDLMQQRWGGQFDAQYKRIGAAVDAVFGQVLESGGQLIDATYFAISSGNTENSQDVWGGTEPYLVSVASPGDVFAGGYQTTVAVTADQLKTAVLAVAPKANLSGDASGWVGAADRTAAGMVKTISVGGQSLTGSQIRSALNLRSSNFTVAYAGGKFTFTVKGYGHDVGMSQAGAQYMARQGSTYRQILSWYYPTTELVKL